MAVTLSVPSVRRVTALQPDLVLLNVRVGDAKTAHIPLIFLTSSSTLDERLIGLPEGAVDYICEPLKRSEVLARVAVHLALASSRRQAQACTAEARTALEKAQGERAADMPSAAYADRVLTRAVKHIVRANLADVPPLPALAARVGTYEKRLSRVFRAQTGRTAFEFVRPKRAGCSRHRH